VEVTKQKKLPPPTASCIHSITMSDRPALSFSQSLALTAVVASLATTSAILTYQSLRRDYRTERLKAEVGRDVAEWEAKQAESEEASAPQTPFEKPEWKWEGEYDESLIREQVSALVSAVEARPLRLRPALAPR
jgi:hypothetical protein